MEAPPHEVQLLGTEDLSAPCEGQVQRALLQLSESKQGHGSWLPLRCERSPSHTWWRPCPPQQLPGAL